MGGWGHESRWPKARWGVGVATLYHYSVSLDEPEHWVLGDRYLQFYVTFDQKALDFSAFRIDLLKTRGVLSVLVSD